MKPWVSFCNAGNENSSVGQWHAIRSPRANQRDLQLWNRTFAIPVRHPRKGRRDFQDRSKRNDVVVPENRLDFWQVGLGKIRSGVDWPIVHSANLERQ